MIIRVNWDKAGDQYSVYETKKYTVSLVRPDTNTTAGCEPYYHLVLLDNGATDLHVSGPSEVYIMNDQGKTIDVIRP